MAYMCEGTLSEIGDLSAFHSLLSANGWTWITAVNVMLFSLMHWPCTTTLLTIRKETGSLKWTLLAVLLPTVFGLAACFLFTTVTRLFC